MISGTIGGTIGCKIIDAISPPLGTARRNEETAGRKTSRKKRHGEREGDNFAFYTIAEERF